MRLPLIPLACAFTVAAGCRGAESPIFEWMEARTVAGASGAPRVDAGGTESTVTAGQSVNAAGTGIVGQAGSGGHVRPDVRFDWTETVPGRGMCSGSVFIGSFNCTVQNSLPARLDGTIVLNLMGPNESQQLDAESGILAVTLDPTGMNNITAPVNGKVVCSNNRSFLGDVPPTMPTADQTGVLFQVFSGLLCASNNVVKGTLVGTLDADALSLRGDIMLGVGACNCRGTFDLRAVR
ncbi:MAG TPA: hypothetical protein VJR89_41835 [Polyangiales bacterium]|nr:hypothetical protein [Polyangiales bacterium]